MAEYRLYCLDGAGHISLAEPLHAADDAEAIAKARAMHMRALKCEVWKSAVLIATLDAHDLAN